MSPSRPLREELIEAAAKAIEPEARKWPVSGTGGNSDAMLRVPAPGFDGASMIELSEAALDAFLDALEVRADEWAEGTRVPTLVGGDALALIAVLRDGDEQ